MRYTWDKSALETTARVLFVINRRGHATPETLADYIRSQAERTLTQPGYVGTGGWYVTAYQPDWAEPDELHMLATVMAYSVELYIERVGQAANVE